MSLALSKGTCGRTFGMANQSGGRAILCRKRASGRHHMDKTGRKTGNQWLTKAGNDKEDTYTMACILLKSIGAPGRNRTHGPQLRRLLLYPTELLAQIWQRQSIKQGFPEVKPDLARFARLGRAGGMARSGRGIPAKNSRAERGVRHCFQVDCGLSPLYASARLEYGLYF